MRIAFVVNDIQSELADYTTTYLAMASTRMGHETWYINISDFTYDTDENIHARSTRVSQNSHRLCRPYLQDLKIAYLF